MKLLSLIHTIMALSVLVPLITNAQGTMVYDQQSSDESNPGGPFNLIQAQGTGQSFTPSLNGIGFVRFNLFDHIRDNGVGATVYVNLRSDSITGPIMDSTAPVALPDNLPPGSFINFFFPANVPLVPGVKYYLQPVVQSGDEWGIMGDIFNYSGGEGYNGGVVIPTVDYWFREGIIVPEPSSFALLALAGGALLLFRRSKCL